MVITYLSNYRRFISNIFSQESLSFCLIHLQFDPKRLDFFSQVYCLRDISFLLTLQLPRKNNYYININNKILLQSNLRSLKTISPNICIQILQTDFYTFPYWISREIWKTIRAFFLWSLSEWLTNHFYTGRWGWWKSNENAMFLSHNKNNGLKVFRSTSSCVKKKKLNKRPLKDMESPSAAVSKILHLVIILKVMV